MRNRIIPANTGRISPASQWGDDIWDHPREYGENQITSHHRLDQLGSSPRIRGESTGSVDGASLDRIIPANTGRI